MEIFFRQEKIGVKSPTWKGMPYILKKKDNAFKNYMKLRSAIPFFSPLFLPSEQYE
jgi:hypothetical protein